MERTKIGETNVPNVIILAVVFSALCGAFTEDLTWFLFSIGTVPVLMLILYIIWLKYGHDGVYVRTINVFIMLMMLTFYCYIPMLYLTFGTWVMWLTLAVYIVVFCICYFFQEPMLLKVNHIDKKGQYKRSSFLLIYVVLLGGVGVIGVWIANGVLLPTTDLVAIASLFYVFSYFFFILSPLFLISPKRALELKIISKDYYDHYR
ncbi:hypothetical protein [Bacillus sp. REN10]|uniref:hypothetical protein n=1 Tax=Bacillus sp. REN10 TaxID=2782541 RepID=UPI00193C0A31|nr:hypothetical protein [Bacillus sp. REN10]